MDTTQTYKDIVLSVIRHLLTGAGTYLTTRGFITADQSNFLITEVAGFAFLAVAAIWVFVKTHTAAKLEQKQIELALRAAPATPPSVIKADAKAELANA